eukprot:144724_1
MLKRSGFHLLCHASKRSTAIKTRKISSGAPKSLFLSTIGPRYKLKSRINPLSQRRFATDTKSMFGSMNVFVSFGISCATLSYTTVNMINAFDMWRNRRTERIQKYVSEGCDYTYAVYVKKKKKENSFDDNAQKEAMDMVYDYVQERIGADYPNGTIKVMAEERIIYLKSESLRNREKKN